MLILIGSIIGLVVGVPLGILIPVIVRRRSWKKSPTVQYALLRARTAPEEWDYEKLSHPDVGAIQIHGSWDSYDRRVSKWHYLLGDMPITEEQANYLKKVLEESRVRLLSSKRLKLISEELREQLADAKIKKLTV